MGLIENALDDIGKDYSGYTVFVDSSGIRHIFKKHGNIRIEQSRGQIAITAEDFVVLWATVPTINHFINKGFGKMGLELLLTAQGSNHTLYFFTFEVRPKFRRLFLKTMYKRAE